eukprot:CAMPEP_0168314762 /NCGR_PEP_ID=MMETSP0210-20121227/9411_1 /TAXON_ID=40633 /ORGANISM="Condylostoma magnum, Strain COL2" /LENGTH=73 /DNA_ID=CAMNT_0008284935 /DNA_START=8115 /DNA_END=8336 /DNA_ORIENTATION=-
MRFELSNTSSRVAKVMLKFNGNGPSNFIRPVSEISCEMTGYSNRDITRIMKINPDADWLDYQFEWAVEDSAFA